MRAIYVDPAKKTITSINLLNGGQLRELVPSPVFGHHRFPECLPNHDAWICLHGIIERRPMWKFGGVMIWGPALIAYDNGDGHPRAATVSADFVRQHTAWA